jgi:dipeptidyl aminopeptidase/acylaminoacyl peptidase
MPWDATRLRVASIQADGTLAESVLAAGGPDESIAQPEWAPDGTLHLVSDRSGWWNLYRLVEGPRLEPLAPMEAEFADPAWIFGRSSYGFLPDGAIVAVARADGRDHMFRIEPGRRVGELEMPFTELDALQVGAHTVVALAGGPADPSVVARFDPVTLAPAGVLRRASTLALDPGAISEPEAIDFPTTGGRTAHALYYAPVNLEFVGPDDEKPPLVVLSHGGPTSNASTALDLAKQLLTSRGIAIVDVDYGGSTGYGREYRRQLDGQWGVVDVDDCVAAAQFLVERGDVDPDRLAIEGGSAGGYTTLAALAFRDVFAAGISHYGVADLELLEREQHKFESRYDQRLVGPYPEAAALFRERSPVHFVDDISAPVLILQGLDDKVVPPSQAETIVAALASNGIPHAYLAFEGEGHGFRGAHAIRRTLEARLSFLGQVFGFEPVDELEPLDLPGLAEWRASHPRPGPLAVPAGVSEEPLPA